MSERKAINELIPSVLYQRGQMLTWGREDKIALLKELDIKVVANFWPKMDQDLAELGIWYLYLPAVRSEMMLEDNILRAAKFVYNLMKSGNAALVLCEAGKTRSVFFCTLLLSLWHSCEKVKALNMMNELLPQHKMKQFMLDYLRE